MSAVLTFLGAAGTVTGSKTLVEHDRRRTLVDCGLYQGERQWRRLNWEPLKVAASSFEDVVLTHTHLDHCGYLPALVRQGFAGPAWCSRASAALVPIVLRDSAHLLEAEAEYARTAGYSQHDPPLPLYTAVDAERAIAPWRHGIRRRRPGCGREARSRWCGRGTCWGRSSALVEVGDTSVLFSGRPRPPAPPAPAPARGPARLRGTSSSRRPTATAPTPPATPSTTRWPPPIRRTVERGGSRPHPGVRRRPHRARPRGARPTCARSGLIPDVPIHLDSPMALKVLEVYRSAAADGELAEDIEPTRRPAALAAGAHRRRVARPQQARAPRASSSRRRAWPTAAGWCTTSPRCSPTRGTPCCSPATRRSAPAAARLADGCPRGQDRRLLRPGARRDRHDEGFSVHADADELLAWLHDLPQEPETVFVNHGEPTVGRGVRAADPGELSARPSSSQAR